MTLTACSSHSYHLSFLSSSLRRKQDLKSLSSHADSITSSVLGEPVDRDSSQRVSLMLAKGANTSSEVDNTPSSWKLPSLNFSRPTLTSNSENIGERTRSSRRGLESPNNGILSPTPERPASSQSHLHRFSKILSIDDTFPELPETLTIFDTSSRSFTPDNFANGSPNVVNGIRKRQSFHFPRPPMPFRRLKGANSLPTIPQQRNVTPLEKDGQSSRTKDSQFNEKQDSPLEVGAMEALELDAEEIRFLTEEEMHNELEHHEGWKEPDIPAVTYELDVPDDLRPQVDHDYKMNSSPRLRYMKDSPALPNSDELLPNEERTTSREAFAPLDFEPTPVPTPPRQAEARRSRSLTGDRAGSNDESIPETSALTKFKLKLRSVRDSTLSPPASRPWNLDESYPWMDAPQVLETPPESSLNTQEEKKDDKPSLSVKIKRRFSSDRRASRSIKKRLSGSSEISCLGLSGKATRDAPESPQPTALPEISEILGSPINPVNTSRTASFRASQISGTFSISMPPSLVGQRLPSPTPPYIDVRSFFSDDSSQVPHRGSLRKRFSNLKGRRPVHKASFTDVGEENENVGPGLPTAQAGRKRANTVIGHEGTIGMTNFEYSRRKMVERLKDWWHRRQAHFHLFGIKKGSGGRDISWAA
jgi:hypothetical protein